MDMAYYISGLLASDKPISSVLSDLKTGKLKHEDVTKHFAAQYRPIVTRKVGLFQRGDLFRAQRQTWTQWLQGIMREDMDAWLEFKSDCWMAGMKEVEPNVESFASARVIQPGNGDRKRILEATGPEHERARDVWGRRNAKEGWTWRAD